MILYMIFIYLIFIMFILIYSGDRKEYTIIESLITGTISVPNGSPRTVLKNSGSQEFKTHLGFKN